MVIKTLKKNVFDLQGQNNLIQKNKKLEFLNSFYRFWITLTAISKYIYIYGSFKCDINKCYTLVIIRFFNVLTKKMYFLFLFKWIISRIIYIRIFLIK